MSIESSLKKDGIVVRDKLDTLTVNSIARTISHKLCDAFPSCNLNRNILFMRLSRLNMYFADMPEGMAEANYFYKNSSIYFKTGISENSLEESSIHECIHFLQEVKDKKNHLLKMGLTDYTDFKICGLGLNEAAVQLIASKANCNNRESVKYFGLDFITTSPSYYPLQCCLINQLAYLVGEDLLFDSTLNSNTKFQEALISKMGVKNFMAVQDSFDDIMDKEEEIVYLTNKIYAADDRNKNIDSMIAKIDRIKEEIKVLFLRTQNLIVSCYFDATFSEIRTVDEVNSYRRKLYGFRDVLATTQGYSFFNDYYLQKLVALDEVTNSIESGIVLETSLSPIPEKIGFLATLIRKIKKLFSHQRDYNMDYNKNY